MDRRSLIKLGGMAALGFAVEGCATASAKPQIAPKRPPLRLPAVNASWDRVIRTTIGLRPHRPSGFVLRADKLDAKTLIHNFGHGGSGMSLSWGTASMATDLALPHTERKAAVLGSGVVGLTSARELQRHGFEVTIYAATVPPDTTSNMSLAGWTPTSGLVENKLRTAEWDAQVRHAATIAYRRLQLLAGSRYGISWITQYQPTDNDPSRPNPNQNPNPILPPELQGRNSQVVFGPGEHPFPTQYCVGRDEMRIEPSIYLEALMTDFINWGGKVVIRKFETPRDIAALAENVIINCTGLGAKAIFSDPELMPLKGQLVVMIPQSEITYGTNGAGKPLPPESGFVHMMPRSDGVVLGGTSIRDNWSTEIEEKERQRVVNLHIELFNSMRSPRPA
jgi:glycine/D-amino acid oxidase-like deaminating enzyme